MDIQSLVDGADAEPLDFETRVKAGNEAIGTEPGDAYNQSLKAILQMAMHHCAPIGNEANLGKFVLVGWVDQQGALTNIQVQPINKTSMTFAEYIGGTRLPTPPWAPYPLTIQMTVRP